MPPTSQIRALKAGDDESRINLLVERLDGIGGIWRRAAIPNIRSTRIPAEVADARQFRKKTGDRAAVQTPSARNFPEFM